MQKIHRKSVKKAKTDRTLIKSTSFSPMLAISVMLMTVLTGSYFIYHSLAKGKNGSIFIKGPVGTRITVAAEGFSSGDLAHNCNPAIGTVNSYGWVVFTNCWTSDNYDCKQYKVAAATKSGYVYSHTTVNGKLDSNWPVCNSSTATGIQVYLKTAPPPPPKPTTPTPPTPRPTTPTPPTPRPTTPTPPTSIPKPAPQPTPPRTPAPSSGSGTRKSTSSTSNIPHPAPLPAPAVVVATSGDTSPPTQPQNLLIEIKDGGVVLSWGVSTDNVAVSGYLIERSTDQEQWDSVVQNLTESSYKDEGLNTGTVYYYRVRAVDAVGNQSAAAVGDIEIPAESDSNTGESQQKDKSGGASALVIGMSLILLGVGGWLWWLRRYRSRNNEAVLRPGPQDTVVVDKAEHTSESLKDMVLEDLHNKNSKSS